jgi:ParB/RepB/Spo0J family partition protein
MATLIQLPIQTLFHSPTNPRKSYPQEQTIELAESIKRHGLINPITVRPMNIFTRKAFESGEVEQALQSALEFTEFEVVAGNRRYKAAQFAGLETVPAMVSLLSDDEVLDLQIDENLHRQDVPPLEEAAGFRFLLDSRRLTVGELAQRVGKSDSYIYRRLNLTNLHESYHPHLQTGIMGVGQAEIIAAYPLDVQAEALPKMLLRSDDGLTIAFESTNYVRRKMADYSTDLSRAPFRPGIEYDGIPVCISCEKNTAVASLLFPEMSAKPKCTDRDCYRKKRKAAAAYHVAAFSEKYKGQPMAYLHAGYSYNYDSDIDAIIGPLMEREPLNRDEYTVCEPGTEGAIPAIYVSGSSWDDDHIKKLWTETYILPTAKASIKPYAYTEIGDDDHIEVTNSAPEIDAADKLEKYQADVLGAIPTATPSLELLLVYYCHLHPLWQIMQFFPCIINAPAHEIFFKWNKGAAPELWAELLKQQAETSTQNLPQINYTALHTYLHLYGILNSSKEEKESALWALHRKQIQKILKYRNVDIKEILFPFAQANGINPVDYDTSLLLNMF